MEEDTEVLDWGHEDDEQTAQRSSGDGRDNWRDREDAEDAVSLGGDEDDMQNFYAYQVNEQDASKGQASTLKSSSTAQTQIQPSKRDLQREASSGSVSQKPPASQSQESDSTQLGRSQSFGKLTHALPPKPVVSVDPYIHPSPATTSTLASSMVQRERRTNGFKSASGGNGGDLPADWEIRVPRSGGSEHYYYNVKTHESTWTRPGPVSGKSSPSKDTESGSMQARDGRSPARNGTSNKVRASSSERRATAESARNEAKRKASPGGELSYEDRHYRPGGAAGPEERGGSVQPLFADASHAAPRPPSPKNFSDRRRSRSPSPPARREHELQDRPARPHREPIPVRSPIDNGMWREGARAAREHPQSRQASVPERGWGARTSMVPDAAPLLPREERPRGRQPRSNFDLSSQHVPLSKEQSIRHDVHEWPASSTLLASHSLVCRVRASPEVEDVSVLAVWGSLGSRISLPLPLLFGLFSLSTQGRLLRILFPHVFFLCILLSSCRK